MTRIPEKIRLKNLELLIAEAGSAAKLARFAGTNSAYISQVRRQTLTKNGTPRSVGDNLAGKLEQGMGKHEGWMDETHQTEWEQSSSGKNKTNTDKKPDNQNLRPLISWIEAGERGEIAGSDKPKQDNELLPCPVQCSQSAYILRVRGISMEPKFHDGDLIFVDPHVNPVSGKYVVIMTEDASEATFRQLIKEDGHQYLKAMNPEWPNHITKFNQKAQICGVVVFKGEKV